MSLLDKIADKARNTTGKMRRPAIILSSIADYVAGTHDEMTGHKRELGKLVGEDGGMRDYQLYGKTTQAGMLGEGVAAMLAAEYCPSTAAAYTLGADCVVRSANFLVSKGKRIREAKQDGVLHSEENYTGVIGIVRAIGCKLAGRLKRSKGDAEAEPEDDPFSDEDFQVPQAKPAADAKDDDEDPLASVEQDDTGNKLF